MQLTVTFVFNRMSPTEKKSENYAYIENPIIMKCLNITLKNYEENSAVVDLVPLNKNTFFSLGIRKRLIKSPPYKYNQRKCLG